MNANNRRGFLKTLLSGGAAAAFVPAVKAAPVAPTPLPQIVTVKITEREVVTEPFPQNISANKAMIWMAIVEDRKRKRWERILKEQRDGLA